MNMLKRAIAGKTIEEYCLWLQHNEMSQGTIYKYRYYLNQLEQFMDGAAVTKERVMIWKETLRRNLSPVTVNGALAAVNGFFRYLGWNDCLVKFIKVKQQVFCSRQKELKREEYLQLVEAAQKDGNERLCLLIQTLCSTGIRISELSYITVTAVEKQIVQVDCKGKVRTIFLTRQLCRLLKEYAEKRKVQSGPIFVTRSGKPMDRSNIWREMKKIGKKAGINPQKIFPHNLRHLFARVYYSQEKDLLRLSDILGHSSVNTTRIYTMESGEKHVRQLERMGLLIEHYNRIPLLL